MAQQGKQKSAKAELEHFYWKCRYCNTHWSTYFFDRHKAACRMKHKFQNEDQQLHSIIASSIATRQHTATVQPESQLEGCMDCDEFVQGSSAMQIDVNFANSKTAILQNVPFAIEGLNLPPEFIKILPHPHSHDPTPVIIPLTFSSSENAPTKLLGPAFQPQSVPWPWAPFKTLADFEYTETAVQGLPSKKLVNKQLASLNSTWAVGSRLSIKNYREMELALEKARKYTVQVWKVYDFTFEYRDPWEWILSLIQDESLASISMWNSVKKYYCSGENEDCLYDEPNTAETWWAVDMSSFPVVNTY
ncbi:hypothetical protein CPB84DRAFT_1672467 [Gymnopilus junonius]|uniref:Uncharacterized protein n=1 Tax=Gymnopilus junonius TaxID=109634 RepID=A0A9P5P020_GYMJU|nr:hypothetical protein CPB84DRAFT_1672467 [Gymnopilus junonius]